MHSQHEAVASATSSPSVKAFEVKGRQVHIQAAFSSRSGRCRASQGETEARGPCALTLVAAPGGAPPPLPSSAAAAPPAGPRRLERPKLVGPSPPEAHRSSPVRSNTRLRSRTKTIQTQLRLNSAQAAGAQAATSWP